MKDPRIARNRKEVEIIQGKGKKNRRLQRRKKKNGAHSDGDVAAYEQERRR